MLKPWAEALGGWSFVEVLNNIKKVFIKYEF